MSSHGSARRPGAVRTSARDILDRVLDPGSWRCWDVPIDVSHHSEAYRAQLAEAQARAGTDESVTSGQGTVRGRPVAVVAGEFGFLAGSIGVAAARRIAAAIRRATAHSLPLLATTASGGTRMQEGTPAFVEMCEISRAIADHRAAGLPYLVHLRHPTTGGVYASWGSLGHVTVAEPGALVGFLGPKVYHAIHGEPFPSGVQLAENLASHGVIDAVVATEDLPILVDRTLRVLLDPPGPGPEPAVFGSSDLHVRLRGRDAWESVERTREPDRIGVRDLLRRVANETVRLSGTDEGERDESIVLALTRLAGQRCVLVGQDRSRQSSRSPLGPGALRVARRGMALARELELPLVTVVDTAGAELSVAAEEGAIAGEIARCIATMSALKVPTVSLLLGQGCGGGALALLPARRIIATEHAWLTPLPPEGASVIVHGHSRHAADMARSQQIRAIDLYDRGFVHGIVPESGSIDEFAERLVRTIGSELAAMKATPPP